AVEYPRELCIHELFEAQVQRTPEAVAVVFGDEQLSYAELNSRANQLAHYLRAQGVGPDSLVGLCVERSAALVVALLGILKAGGAYVPLDPNYPRERLEYMIEDSGPVMVLTQEWLEPRLLVSGVPKLRLQADKELLSSYRTDNPGGAEVGLSAAHLVYVIYTSGSSGQPKGAMVEHGGIVNCIAWMQETYQLDGSDKFLAQTSLNFDPSVWEILWPLTVGAVVVLARAEGHYDPGYLKQLIISEEVTTAYLVPSLLRQFLAEPGVEQCSSLKRVISGGAALSGQTIDRFHRLLAAELHHSYGPTEASIAASEWSCPRVAETGAVALGRPLGNTQLYVLDKDWQVAPLAVAGELYIGGVGVGRGYRNRAELTAERFVPDGFSKEPGRRLYRTGDVVRYWSDGNLEFLGRVDQQVKVRGYRIELGEIEAALLGHGGVQEAVVVAREEADGEKRLIGYIVPVEQGRVSAEDLTVYLAQRLPDYMVPAIWLELEQIPVTNSGKIDRQALPQPERVAKPEGFLAPRDSLEVQLLSIWEHVLNISPISVQDNFFTLGGHSLDAVSLVSQIHSGIGQDLPVIAVFENPTIDQLAAVLRERNWPGVLRLVDELPQVDSPLVSIHPSGAKPPFFFVSALGGILPSNIISSVLDLAPHLDLDQPFYGLQLPGLIQSLACHFSSNVRVDDQQLRQLFLKHLQENPPLKIVRDGAARCITAMREIQPSGPYHLAGFCTGGIVAFEIASQLSQRGQEVGLLVLLDTA
ncbi:MAG TPA: amino acid adenylation domain-containing protein, partial [Pyrinomonadaceae bacterium]|nr:amino acid adenylation domain-containing protein [Pyrinomonadaceae bacterium]